MTNVLKSKRHEKHGMDLLLRYQIFCLYFFLYTGVWIAVKSEIGEESSPIIDYAPLWAVMAIGTFAAYSIFSGVYSIEDCPEAAAEVEKDVKEALSAMKSNGVCR